MKFWSEVECRWIDADVTWSGTLHRQDERAYSLIGGGMQRLENVLQVAAPAKDAYPSRKEVKKANLVVADQTWREYRPPTKPKTAPVTTDLHPVKVACRNCGKSYKTRRPNSVRICPQCRSHWRKKAA